MDHHAAPPNIQTPEHQASKQWSEQAPLTGEFDKPTTRRGALLWLIRAGLAAFALAFVIPALALRTLRTASKAVATGDELVYAQGQDMGATVNAHDLKANTAVHVFPRGKTNDSDNLIELVHLKQGSPEFVAYSAICTHLGCTVLTNLTESGDIPCPCHGSVFNPAKGAAVVAGPAPRPLPSLPIKVQSDGSVTVTGGFSAKIGPD